ncbi:MAG TPA: HEAT repeat domain-containing protein [Bacteroidia bacterium]|nr:HEAT repeat domain-containing protein [Bacteroidia bacterium]
MITEIIAANAVANTAEKIANAVNYPFAHNIETIVVFMILLFTYSSIILFLAVIILRLRKNQFEKRAEFIKSALNGLIMGAAFAGTEEELNEVILQAKPAFSKHIKTSSQGQIMINEVMNMHSNLTGQSKHNLSRLFMETCLMTYTMRNLGNENWHVKASAIRTLAQINSEAHIPKIEKYALHHNIYLQQEAQIALVNLRGYDGLDFLGKLKNALSDWQQINLLDVLRKLDKDKAPDFSQWLSNKEDTIKLFSIRLIHFFQQGYNSDKLEAFVNSENKLLRNEAIAALQKIKPGSHFATSNTVKA